MKEIRIIQNKVDKRVVTEMWFKSLNQLFDPTDPSPFPEKELTDLAEDSIFEEFVDLYVLKDDNLIINIPKGSIPTGSEDLVAKAVNRHFSFRLVDLAKEKKSSWREGKVSVCLAIINAFIGITVVYIFFITAATSFFFNLIVGVFLVINWVTIWDSYEYFLYDYRKLWRKYRVYRKLIRTSVTVRQTTNS